MTPRKQAKTKERAPRSRAGARATKGAHTEEAATPLVVGGRYCLSCGKLLLMVALDADVSVPMRGVGTAASPCCGDQAALLLLPTTTAQPDPMFPARIPTLPDCGAGIRSTRAAGGAK